MMLSQEQYSVLRQPTRRLLIKIDLINEKDIIVGSFEGIAIDGMISLSNEGTYRRSGNITMVFDKKYNLLPSPSSKIWFNKRCAITIGAESYSGEIIPFKLGRFAIDEVDLNFSGAQKTMSCQLKDYMAFLDGTLDGTLSHKILIEEGTPMSDAIKTVLSDLGKVSVEDIKLGNMELKLPYTIERGTGSNVHDLMVELVGMYMGWDFYFNEEGYLIVEKIKDKSNDPIIEYFDGSERDLTINSTPKFDFKNVKNSIWVWGSELEDGTQIKWSYRNRWARKGKLDLDSLTDKQKGDICHIENENNSYMYNGEKWELLDFKVVPIFNMEQIGEKKWTYSDDKIFNEEQARLRAEYELKTTSNLAETINFSCVPLYYLVPNKKIQFNIEDLIQGDYLISNVSVSLSPSSDMSISGYKIYY